MYSRHIQVGKNQVWPGLFETNKRLFRRSRDLNGVAKALQQDAQHLPHGQIIIDN
jgi:hypothetical protein